MQKSVVSLVVVFVCFLGSIHGHVRIMEPPSRASKYECGWPDHPKDLEAWQSWCGGYGYQTDMMGRECDICGDSYDRSRLQPLKNGGKPDKDVIIAREYTRGQIITIKFEILINHLGEFRFSLCPTPDTIHSDGVTEECLQEHVLTLADGTNRQWYPVRDLTQRKHTIRLHLPPELTCTKCTLQMHHKTGTNLGPCEDGSYSAICGPQDVYRACVDISISEGDGRGSDPDQTSNNGENNADESSNWRDRLPFRGPKRLLDEPRRPRLPSIGNRLRNA